MKMKDEQEETSEAQKKLLVDKAQRTSLELLCVGKERRRFDRKKAERVARVPGRNSFWENLEDGSSFSLDSDAAAGRLEPKGEAEVLKILQESGSGQKELTGLK